MDKQTYLAMHAQITSQIQALQGQLESLRGAYLSQFPKVGDLVLHKGDRYHICKVHFWENTNISIQFDLRKPKKDGSPSNGGRIEYYIGLSEIEPIEMVAQGEK